LERRSREGSRGDRIRRCADPQSAALAEDHRRRRKSRRPLRPVHARNVARPELSALRRDLPVRRSTRREDGSKGRRVFAFRREPRGPGGSDAGRQIPAAHREGRPWAAEKARGAEGGDRRGGQAVMIARSIGVLAASAPRTQGGQTRPMVDWIIPALPTNTPQTPQQAENARKAGRQLPPPEILQPTLDPALPAYQARKEKLSGTFKGGASDVL